MAFAHTPPPAAGGSFPARTSVVTRCLLPWSYHGSVFCCKGPSSSEEPLSCFLTVGTANSGSLMPGISTLCENRSGRTEEEGGDCCHGQSPQGSRLLGKVVSVTLPGITTHNCLALDPGLGLHRNQDNEVLAIIVTVSWCLCMYIHICVCVCVFIYVCVFTCKLIRTRADTYMHVCILSFS